MWTCAAQLWVQARRTGQPAPWITVDFVRIEDGILVEHWDVIEAEASRKESLSGLPMYGDDFPEEWFGPASPFQ
ncbi:hypothetical protein ACFRIB_21070 [Streptomyces mirabilis]|uniref:hypothetical protein n=1 Tax=Streptomyces mirabilis TaxID=68239 RepID=UPI003685D861